MGAVLSQGRLGPFRNEILAMRRSGSTLREIAERFDCTYESIRLICADEGVKVPLHPIQMERVFRAVAVIGRLQLQADNDGTISGHGTRYHYVRKRCRCDLCVEANREYGRSLRARGEAPHHGKSGYMNYGCRCDVCKAAHSEEMRRYKRGRRLRDAARASGEGGDSRVTRNGDGAQPGIPPSPGA